MTDQEYILYLLEKSDLTETEVQWLANRESEPDDPVWQLAAQQYILRKRTLNNIAPSVSARESLTRVMSRLKIVPSNDSESFVKPVHRVHFIKTAWFRYAAIILLFIGIGTLVWIINSNRNKDNAEFSTTHIPKRVEVLPGSDKAVLTLADGRTIILDSAVHGQLAQQGNTSIIKSADGKIEYDVQGKSSGDVMMNTMSTPRGGQYQLMLPDGSRVWLNAASSITYPTAFIGKERKVSIKGEVYFEIAPNKEKPFYIDVNGRSDIQVLGTGFNINSYEDEENIKTTLINGSIKVNQQVILQPGQQAIIQSAEEQPKIINADVNKVLAWKNGLFNFSKSSIQDIMRQIARWYDVDIEYQGAIGSRTFSGKMQRDLTLSEVLESLKDLNVQFKVEGRKVIVMP